MKGEESIFIVSVRLKLFNDCDYTCKFSEINVKNEPQHPIMVANRVNQKSEQPVNSIGPFTEADYQDNPTISA